MEAMSILQFPDPRLRIKATPVDLHTIASPLFQHQLDAMFHTMYQASGIGLAATQVDIHQRFMVIDITKDNSEPMVFLNPQIVAREGTQVYREGCLSIPRIFAEVTRADTIEVEFLDRSGQQQKLTANGLLAVCIQHEIDHLDGQLFIDHLSALKRAMVEKKIAKQARQLQQDQEEQPQ